MKQQPVVFVAESFELAEEKTERGGYRVRGLALPFGKRSRNGLLYDEQSCIETAPLWAGLPMLFNHDKDKPIGHLVEVKPGKITINGEEVAGLIYEGDIDPEESWIVRKIKRGDVPFVSIQAIVEKAGEDIEADVLIRQPLEISPCTIPGFPQT